MALLSHRFPFTPGWARAVQVAAAVLTCTTAPASVPAGGSREHQIKAAALHNLITFTDWPASAFADAGSPLVVGVLGKGPVAALLDDFVANETWQGRRISLRRLSTPAEGRDCHVLYVERSEHARWPALASQFSKRAILTVSDSDLFARRGGVVQLAIERNKLRLIVNLKVARACGLTISSKVLRLANVIEDPLP
jgi:hypothetical protein